jgi:TnpA family transposase
VYWHVEEKYVVVHCQVLKASASEVAAMVEGAVRHGTAMKLEGNYTDTHSQSLIGFGITRLLDIDLLPRIKQINTVRLYRPESTAGGDPYPNLAPALHGPVNWRVIAENHDTVVKYATAIHEAPRPPRPCSPGSATPFAIPPTRPCWRSAKPRERSSWRGTCTTGTCSGRSNPA